VVACAGQPGRRRGLAVLVWLAGLAALNHGARRPGTGADRHHKAQLPWGEAFFRGVLCNVLVCMAVWMALAGRSVTDKVLAIVFPITAFVAAGFEHSWPTVLLPAGDAAGRAAHGLAAVLGNLLPVIAGNIVGGSVLVAAVYWVIYLRVPPGPPTAP
jgi:formate transporter